VFSHFKSLAPFSKSKTLDEDFLAPHQTLRALTSPIAPSY